MFVNRVEEKTELSKFLKFRGFGFAIFYGRRRIGKTRLVLEALKNSNYVYYLATEKNNLPYFITAVSQKFPEVINMKEDWETVLDFVKNRAKVLAIDEFQNLVKEDKNILTLFQRAIDTNLKNSNLKIIILGSSISLISSQVLSYKSPLYGRKTFSKKMQPINFFNLRGFFPKTKIDELMQIYGFADGIPYYLEKITPPFWHWLDGELKNPSFVKDELNFILKYEFEELGTYKTILEAIANGKNTVSEIKNYCKMQRTDISPYLVKLIDTELIQREVPITEKLISKKGRYHIKDQFIAFWFRYIHPNLSNIEENIFTSNSIKKNYSDYMGFVFEKICRQALVKLIKSGELNFEKIGRWWHDDKEIDIIAINEENNEILFGECKWREKINAEKILVELKQKAAFVQWKNKNRKERYVVFAKSFVGNKKLEENVHLFDFGSLEKLLQ